LAVRLRELVDELITENIGKGTADTKFAFSDLMVRSENAEERGGWGRVLQYMVVTATKVVMSSYAAPPLVTVTVEKLKALLLDDGFTVDIAGDQWQVSFL
jgi:hypothetical protein